MVDKNDKRKEETNLVGRGTETGRFIWSFLSIVFLWVS